MIKPAAYSIHGHARRIITLMSATHTHTLGEKLLHLARWLELQTAAADEKEISEMLLNISLMFFFYWIQDRLLIPKWNAPITSAHKSDILKILRTGCNELSVLPGPESVHHKRFSFNRNSLLFLSFLFLFLGRPLVSPGPPRTHATFMAVWNKCLQQETEGHILLSKKTILTPSNSPSGIWPATSLKCFILRWMPLTAVPSWHRRA